MAQAGRPSLGDDAKKVQLTLRLSSAEAALLQSLSERLGITRTAAIFKGLELLERKLNRDSKKKR